MTAEDGVGVNNVTALKRMRRTKGVKGLSVTLWLHSKHGQLRMIASEGLFAGMRI